MEKISLNGTWDFVADLDPRYHASSGFRLPGCNRRHWLKVSVPGVWQKYGERYDIFEGVCWFSREFQVDCFPKRASARLRFGAVSYLCNVYVNGVNAGSHEGGYTEFTLDVTDKLREGRNHIAVQVDNRASIIKWPTVIGYFNYGGIHRDVSLEIIDGPALDQIRLDSVKSGGGWELCLRGRVLNSCPGLAVRIGNGDSVSWEDEVPADGSLDTRAPFFGATDWTPDNPHLEPVFIELLDTARNVLDRRDFSFGFRRLEIRDGQALLNGKPFRVNGVCYVYDSPVTGLVMTPEHIDTDLRLMKETGCNAVRCHYPMDRVFYDSCDKLGLLVWIEPPVYCYHPGDKETGTHFADSEWLALARRMALEMIDTARNHPSVAIYSVGNECNTQNQEAETFFRRLAATIREADGTRLISYAALYGNVGALADIVDVLGINSYWGWYDQIRQDGSDVCRAPESAGVRTIDLAPMRKMLDKALADKADFALFLTEFGADSVPGNYSAGRDLWSEDYHAALLREIFALTKDYPRIVGTFPFCFCDYRDPSKVHNGYWNELNLKGVVDYNRNKKLAFHTLKAHYGGGKNL